MTTPDGQGRGHTDQAHSPAEYPTILSCQSRPTPSPGTKFNKSSLISWRNSTQWGPLLPKGGGMIQVDIGGHPLIPLGSQPVLLLVFQFP